MDFFKKVFPDAVPLMPTLLDDYFANPTPSLVTIRCDPWYVMIMMMMLLLLMMMMIIMMMLLFVGIGHVVVLLRWWATVHMVRECYVNDYINQCLMHLLLL